jgi:hypothetical protein
MDYTGILQRSFDITRRHRALWLFGFLLALFSLGGGTSNGFRFVFQEGGPLRLEQVGREFLLALALVAGLIVVILTVITTVINYVAQTALIGMVGEIEAGQTPPVRRGFEIGWSRRALRLFGADLVVFVPVAVVVALVIGAVVALLVQADQAGAPGAALVLLICCLAVFALLLIPLLVVLNVLQRFFYRRIVLAGDGVFDGIRNGWEMIRANVGPVAVIWLIMFVIGLVWTAVNFLLVLSAFALVGLPAAAIYALVGSGLVTALMVLPLVIIALLALAAINALYTVFSSTVWTLTYLELPQPVVGA